MENQVIEVKSLKTKIFEALGEVSMCWSETPKGVFDSNNAERIGNQLVKDIEREVEYWKTIVENILRSNAGRVILLGENQLLIDMADMRNDKSEGSLYHAYQCNIAMAFQDEFNRFLDKNSNFCKSDIYECSNNAAKNFLDLLIKE